MVRVAALRGAQGSTRRVRFEEPLDVNLLAQVRLARCKFDAATLRALVELLPCRSSRRLAVVGNAPASHTFVAGVYAHGIFYGVSSSCREFESVVKYLTAFVRSRIGVPFAAIGVLDGCSLEARRDSHNLRGSLSVVIPLTQGGLWIEDEDCCDSVAEWQECPKGSGNFVKGRVFRPRDGVLVFPPHLWHASAPSERRV